MKNKLKLPALALLSGVLLAMSFPPYNFTLSVFVGIIPLLYLEHKIVKEQGLKGKTGRKVFLLSYLAFFTWNLLSCWWIYNAAFVGAAFEILANSLLYALMFLVFHLSKKTLNKSLWPFCFVLFWMALEYLHFQDWELSWPWLVLGNAFANMPYLVQWYEYTGTLGGSLWVLVINWMLLQGVIIWRENKKVTPDAFRIFIRTDFYILAPMVLSIALYLSYTEEIKPVNVLVVQPNIDPYNEKFGSMSERQQIDKMLGLAKAKITDSTQYVILPETAMPGGEWEEQFSESANIERLSSGIFNQNPKIKIVSGISSYAEVFPENVQDVPGSFRKDDKGWYESYNTAVQIDTTFNFQIYHKSLLVIGVEKMPFANLLKPLNNLILDYGGTTGSLGVQRRRSVFTAPDSSMAIAPIICYESIYSDYVAEYVQNGAQLLFIMTNDGWWGTSPGYQQHFAFARLRAIENRRSIARSANTGTSGFINQRGDIIAASEFWVPDALAQTINANDKLTIFTRFPKVLGSIAFIGAAVLLLAAIILRFKKRNPL
ncbi:MAG: apolipoprotein N-acyltransferase [Bacteroidetes bacterium]|nr:apolipoprotein N-acyltransferase [Bacteroidota bacterium]